jgi:radical SAM protein with 4Fe4S-binding SPASM domain
MCGRRKREREHPELCDYGDMPYDTLRLIHFQVPRGIVVQYHNNGEPLLYPFLGRVLGLFRDNIRCLDTNAKLLVEKADEIIGNLETLTISVIESDTEGDEQYEIVKKFREIKGDRGPKLIYRLLGRVPEESRWYNDGVLIAKRILHAPEGSRCYEKQVTVPEIGICLDLLTHLAIDRHGNISMCVRFDPHGLLRLGNVNDITLRDAWLSPKRKSYLEHHIRQERSKLPGCSSCEFWGVPRGE